MGELSWFPERFAELNNKIQSNVIQNTISAQFHSHSSQNQQKRAKDYDEYFFRFSKLYILPVPNFKSFDNLLTILQFTCSFYQHFIFGIPFLLMLPKYLKSALRRALLEREGRVNVGVIIAKKYFSRGLSWFSWDF